MEVSIDLSRARTVESVESPEAEIVDLQGLERHITGASTFDYAKLTGPKRLCLAQMLGLELGSKTEISESEFVQGLIEFGQTSVPPFFYPHTDVSQEIVDQVRLEHRAKFTGKPLWKLVDNILSLSDEYAKAHKQFNADLTTPGPWTQWKRALARLGPDHPETQKLYKALRD